MCVICIYIHTYIHAYIHVLRLSLDNGEEHTIINDHVLGCVVRSHKMNEEKLALDFVYLTYTLLEYILFACVTRIHHGIVRIVYFSCISACFFGGGKKGKKSSLSLGVKRAEFKTGEIHKAGEQGRESVYVVLLTVCC